MAPPDQKVGTPQGGHRIYSCPERSNLVWANGGDRELRVAGPVTQAMRCGAGVVGGFHSLSVSSLVIKLAIDTRAVAVVAATLYGDRLLVLKLGGYVFFGAASSVQ